MSDVPSNLIPTRITQLPIAPEASEDSLMMIVYQGNNYQIRVGDLLSVAGVPTTRQVIAGTGLTGGGQLSSNVTLSVANGGITGNQLNTTGVTAGSYGDATHIPVFTVDENGRVTAANTIAVSVSGYVPVTRQVIAGNGLTGGGALNSNVTLTTDLSDSTPQSVLNSGSAGVATSVSRSDHKHPQIDLSSSNEVTNILGLSHGGTAKSIVPNAGAIVWSGADGLYVSPAGTAGQVLVSGGASAPTWGNTILVADQPANVVYAGPTSGSAATTAFRALVNADLPTSTVTANTYGSSTTIPVITVNSKGIVTSVTTSSIIGTLSYQGGWNASTNVPALASSVGTSGYYYVVTTAGSTNLNGITDWAIGDWAIFNGSTWQKIDQTNTVTSVNGQTGAVSVGTVTSVGGTGTVNGITLTGTVTSTGDLTLGGTLSGVSLTTQVSGTLPIANGGTGTTTPALVAGTNVTITGTWPNQTINATSGGSGSVTTVSVVSANGFAGTVANPSSTPDITLTTSISGMLKGSASALVAATAGTDFSAGTSALATGILKSTTSTGALSIAVAADFPTLNQSTTGNATTATTATNLASGSAGTIPYQSASGTTAMLAAGTAGQVLTSNGAAAPTWATASGGGGTKTISNKTGAYTVVAGDLGTIINCTANSFTVSLTAAATLGSGFTCAIWNTSGTGADTITIDPATTETIDGKPNLILKPGEGLAIVCDGTNWQTDDKKPMRVYAENVISSAVRPSLTGIRSVAIGAGTTAFTDSMALGNSATASGDTSFAAGQSAIASGVVSLALGAGTTASGTNTTAIGRNSGNTASQAVTGAGAMALGGSYASGADSFAAAIANNTSSYGATNTGAIAMGRQSNATGSGAIAIGYNSATASGINSFAQGYVTTADARSSIALGDGSNTKGVKGKFVFSGCSFSATASGQGFIQMGHLVLSAYTTTTTAVVLTSDAGTATTNNQLIVASDQAMAIQGTLIAKVVSSGAMAGWNITGIVSNNAGTMAVSGLALTAIGSDSITLGASPTIAVDNTNKGVTITSGYKSATSIRWVATVNTSEVIA